MQGHPTPPPIGHLDLGGLELLEVLGTTAGCCPAGGPDIESAGRPLEASGGECLLVKPRFDGRFVILWTWCGLLGFRWVQP